MPKRRNISPAHFLWKLGEMYEKNKDIYHVNNINDLKKAINSIGEGIGTIYYKDKKIEVI